jgi:glycine betaine/choline ABC-type transport system substrate-binding protein
VPRLPRRAGALALVLAVGLSVAACGPQDQTAAGVVIAVDAPVGQVNGFTLRTTDGQVMSFVIGTLETDAGAFPAFHLAVHAATLQPIAVAYRVEDGRNVVYRMADAPWAQPS